MKTDWSIKKLNNGKSNYYFRIDERQNTLDSLQKTRIFLSKIKEDEFYWKWAMIALHNTLYGSMILTLMGSSPERVKDKKRNIKNGEVKVISFWEAFRRIQKPAFMKMYVGSKFVCITSETERLKENPEYKAKTGLFPSELNVSVKHLNNYIRNQFMHYYPVSISFGKGGFFEILEDIIELIQFLLLESGNFTIDNDKESNCIMAEISSILNITQELKRLQYEN